MKPSNPPQAHPGYAFVNFVDGPAEGLRQEVSLPRPAMAMYWLAGMSEPDIDVDDPIPDVRPARTVNYFLRRRIHPDGRIEWVYSIHGPRT